MTAGGSPDRGRPRRRGGRGRSAAIAAALVFAACSGAVDAPPSAIPVNDCTSRDCSAYRQPTTAVCQSGFCALHVTLEYSLVVSGPDTTAIPGTTVAFTPRTDQQRPVARCAGAPRCGSIPGLSLVSGSLAATESQEAAVGRSLHGVPGQKTSIPAHVEYRPLAPARSGDDAKGIVLAADVALPLPSLFGRAIVGDDFPSTAGSPPGPGGTPPIGWVVSLQPGLYLRYVTPDPPFDDAFPPSTRSLQIFPSQFGTDHYVYDHIDPVSDDQTFDVASDGPSLAGWTAALYDRPSQRRVSAIRTLAGPETVLLYTSRDASETKIELVLAPPRGVVAPELGFPKAPVIPRSITYPRVEPARHVSGRVLTTTGEAVAAELIFRSTEPLASSIPNTPIRYRATAFADASGDFSVDLFEGVYEVAVVPLGHAEVATTLVPRFEVSGESVQGGKSVSVAPQSQITGLVVLADDRPLVGADVVATPTPTPFDPDHPLARVARVARTTTGPGGTYRLPVDPGYYDVTIKPLPGSRFPWVVATSIPGSKVPIVIAGDAVDLGKITVPLPVDEGGTLFDPSGSRPLQGARVRAYYTIPSRNPLEIGEATTDANGKYELFLTQPL